MFQLNCDPYTVHVLLRRAHLTTFSEALNQTHVPCRSQYLWQLQPCSILRGVDEAAVSRERKVFKSRGQKAHCSIALLTEGKEERCGARRWPVAAEGIGCELSSRFC